MSEPSYSRHHTIVAYVGVEFTSLFRGRHLTIEVYILAFIRYSLDVTLDMLCMVEVASRTREVVLIA